MNGFVALVLIVASPVELRREDLILPWGQRHADARRQLGGQAFGEPPDPSLFMSDQKIGKIEVTRELYFVHGRLAFAKVRLHCTQWPRKPSDISCETAFKAFAAKFAPTPQSDGGCIQQFEIGTTEVRRGNAESGSIVLVPIWRPALPVYEALSTTGCF